MEHKKDLAKIALATLILASATPVNGQADHYISEEEGIYLAAACPAHGCPAESPSKKVVADNANGSSNAKKIGSSFNQNDKNPSSEPNGTSNSSPPATHRKDNDTAMTDRHSGRSSDTYSTSSYDSQRSGVTSPYYVEDRSNNTFDATPAPYKEHGGMTNLNRDYNTTSDYDYNRAAVTTSASLATLTEAQLIGLLNSQARAIYLNLDPEGKALAIQLASLDSYRDKNLAIKEAQRRMNERRGLLNR